MDTLKPLDLNTLTESEADLLYERVMQHNHYLDDFTRDNPIAFAARLASPDTVAFLYGDKALLTLENIVPNLGANFHIFSWARVPEEDAVTVAAAVIGYGFQQFNLHRVTAAPPENNKFAIRGVVDIGFQYEGRIREAFLQDGHFVDVFLYGMTRGDYINLYNSKAKRKVEVTQ